MANNKQQKTFVKREKKMNVDMDFNVVFDPRFEDIEGGLALLCMNDVYEKFGIPVFAYRADVMADSKFKKTTIIVGHVNKFELPEDASIEPFMNVNVYGINAEAISALEDKVVMPVFRQVNGKLSVVKFVITTNARIAEDVEQRAKRQQQ